MPRGRADLPVLPRAAASSISARCKNARPQAPTRINGVAAGVSVHPREVAGKTRVRHEAGKPLEQEHRVGKLTQNFVECAHPRGEGTPGETVKHERERNSIEIKNPGHRRRKSFQKVLSRQIAPAGVGAFGCPAARQSTRMAAERRKRRRCRYEMPQAGSLSGLRGSLTVRYASNRDAERGHVLGCGTMRM